jgi:hypothetical protein
MDDILSNRIEPANAYTQPERDVPTPNKQKLRAKAKAAAAHGNSIPLVEMDEPENHQLDTLA